MINGDDSVVEELVQSLPDNHSSMRRCSILRPPDSSETPVGLPNKMLVQLWNNLFIDDPQVLFSIEISFEEVGSNQRSVATESYPDGNLLTTDVDIVVERRWVVDWRILPNVLIVDLAIHEERCFVPDDDIFGKPWVAI